MEGLASQYLEIIFGKYGNIKKCTKKNVEIQTKRPSIRTAPNRSFLTTLVHPVSVLILHPRDTNYVVTDIETTKKQTSLIKEGKSSTSVTGTRAQHKKKHHPGNKSYEKIQNE